MRLHAEVPFQLPGAHFPAIVIVFANASPILCYRLGHRMHQVNEANVAKLLKASVQMGVRCQVCSGEAFDWRRHRE